MSNPIIILGAGGHAKVLIDTLLLKAVEIVGILDPLVSAHGTRVMGVPVLGGDELLDAHSAELITLVNGIGSVRAPERRKVLFDACKAKGFSFADVVHPSAVIAGDVRMAEGAQIMAGAVIQAGGRMGRNVIINTNASVDHDCTIADHVHIAPGVTLSGGVSIGDCVHIGAGATVIEGVKIGRNSVIGAGTLVLKNVAEGETVIGVPGKAVRK